MLNYRKVDYPRDLDQILSLIKKNLNPDFTLSLFKWKHLKNPFGQSYGLLALDGDKIVGLRMFMFWNFSNSAGKIIKAIRPVDTVVDIEYRGQGLFKRLTLKGLEECKTDYDFIFNTPNQNSLPGYLKMGWQNLDQVKSFKIALVNPFADNVKTMVIEADSIDDNREPHIPDVLSTYRSTAYFKWRYQSNQYKIAYFPGEGIYIAYNISNKLYLIVNEVFGNTKALSAKMLNSLAKKMKKPFIYYYDQKTFNELNFLLTYKRSVPVVVLKDHKGINSVNNINFSLADLEAVF